MVGFTSCKNQEHTTQTSEETKLTDKSHFDYESFIGNDFHIDDQHSYIGFKIKYFGFSPVRGRFNEFNGTLFYDPLDLTVLRVSVFIDVGSINTGNKRRDNDLRSEGTWFDTNKFPNIIFSSSEVIPKSNGAFDLIGYLTIKGITKVDTISFDKPTDLSKDWAGNNQVDFSGKIIINRQDYEVFGGEFWSAIMENGITQLSDKVEIELDIHTRKFDYQERYDSADSSDLVKLILAACRKAHKLTREE